DASGLPAGTDLAHLGGRQLGAAWRPVLDRLRCEGEVEVRPGPAHVVVRVDEGDDLAFGLRCAPGLVEEVLGFGEETVDVTHRRALRRHGRTAQTSRPPRCSATTRNTASATL